MGRAHCPPSNALNPVDVVVLTALGVEYDAVRAHLGVTHPHVDDAGTRYEVGRLVGGRCRVALAVLGVGNLAAAALTGRAVRTFRPNTVLLVGVAGGLKDEVALGDVVVGTRIYGYHAGREDAAGFRPRPHGWPVAHSLEQLAAEIAAERTWFARLPTRPAVHLKPIVAGEVVLDSRASPTARLIAEYYGDAAAIDMESAGVAEAAHRGEFHRLLTVRGISDAADGSKANSDAAGWQQRAAAHAATFAAALAERIVTPAARPGTLVAASPYRGLAAFREQDSTVFFGRDDLADELAVLVRRSRLTAVTGRSGSGKSSLVHAGLAPRLRLRGFAVAGCRPLPGQPPAIALAGALLPLLRPYPDPVAALSQRDVLAGALAAGRLPEIVGDVLAATGRDRLLVCLDQFEEYLATADADELVRLLTAPAVPTVHVVLTLRTATLDLAAGRPGFRAAARSSVFLVTPMEPDQLRAAVADPVARTGVRFEPGLVERVLEADPAPALALLQFALTRLWDEQDAGLLTHAAYDAIGGVGGALAGYAEQVWTTDLDDAERVGARRLLVQLVRPDSDHPDSDGVVRRTARAVDLPAGALPVAERLAATRLVVAGTGEHGEPTYDLAHAALARHWHRLRGWLSEEREFRSWQEDLRAGMSRGEDLRGARLAAATHWLRARPAGLTAAERAYVLTGRRRGRLRTAAVRATAALVVVLLVAMTGFAVDLRRRTGELAEQVRRNAVNALVDQAAERAGSEPDTAVLLTVAAYRAGADPMVLRALAGEYLRYRSTGALLDLGVGEINQVEQSADGTVVAALGAGGISVRRPGSPPARWAGPWTRFALSRDGRWVAAATTAGRVEVRELDGPARRLRADEDGGTLPAVLRFDHTGNRLLVVLAGGYEIWDLGAGRQVRVHPRAVEQNQLARAFGGVWFGPAPDSVVVATTAGLEVRAIDSGTVITTVPTGVRVLDTTIVADGTVAVTCFESEVESWDLAGGRRLGNRAMAGNCPDMAAAPTDPAGRLLLTAAVREGGDTHPRERVTLTRETGEMAVPTLPIPAAPNNVAERVTELAGGGARLVTAVGTAVAVVDVAAEDFAPINKIADNPVFSPDGRLAATAPANPALPLRLWHTDSGSVAGQVPNPQGLRPVLFAGDRLLLADAERGRLATVDVADPIAPAPLQLPAVPDAPPGLCADSWADGPVTVLSGGYLSRVDPAPAIIGPPVPLANGTDNGAGTGTGLGRLARPRACAAGPNDLFAFGTGATVEVWDLAGRTRVTTVDSPSGGHVAAVRFSADSRRLAVLSQDGTLRVVDTATWQPVGEALKALGAGLFVAAPAFPTADRLVAHGVEGVRVWDLSERTVTTDVDALTGGTPAVLTPAGTLILWTSAALTTMPLDPESWATALCDLVGRDLSPTERATLPPGSPTAAVCPR